MAAQKQEQKQEPEQKQKQKQKQEQKDTKKEKNKIKKRLPIILKMAVCLVLAAAILAFVPYVVEFVNIKVEESAKKQPTVSSKLTASAASKQTASAASKAASSASSTSSQQTTQQTTQQAATKKAATVPLTSMKPVLQAPEFLSGCEVSALTAVLNYYGEPMDKVTLSVLFLPTDNTCTTKGGKTYRANPWKVFVGNPESNCYGCFAPVIVETANQYLKAVGSDKRATNLTGAKPSKLYESISKNIPVIVWATQNMEKSSTTATWYDKDTNKLFEWPGSEHCMVLLASTDTTVTVCDPAKGIVNYDRKTFEERYKELYQQAVVIQ
jgi:uncharacterized protein YvpB